MILRHRPMEKKDVAECVEIVASHPVIGARYGPAIKHLAAAWQRLLKMDSKRAVVLEDLDGPRTTICAVGVSVIVSEDFMKELKTPPLFWQGPELAMRFS